MTERKPLAPMESREPHSIRYTPSEWDAITTEARARGIEPAVFVRKLSLIALEDVTRYARREESLGIPAVSAAGSQRTRRI